MMLKGSENVGSGEHFVLIFNNGGSMNGTTNADRTNYFETLPANQLDLALYLEADRMRSLAITKENLDNQRNAVQEERRLGVDNQPYGKTFETIQELAYENFAYKHSTIGSMEDLNAATVDDVAAFFKTRVSTKRSSASRRVPSRTELEKARNNALRGFVGSLQSSLQRAILMSEYAVFFDNPDLINTRYQRVQGITAADVQRVAKQYLTPANRTVVVTMPAAPALKKGDSQ